MVSVISIDFMTSKSALFLVRFHSEIYKLLSDILHWFAGYQELKTFENL